MNTTSTQLEPYIVQFTISFFCGLPSIFPYFEKENKRLKQCVYQDLIQAAKSIPKNKWDEWKELTIYFISMDQERLQQIDVEIAGFPFRQKVVQMILDVLYKTILE